jgi:hypothetical protein
MITINNRLYEKQIDCYQSLRLEPEDCLFFDIETTGFSASNSQLYLIGVVYFDDGQWCVRQWFADTFDSEEAVLRSFFDFVSQGFKYLISFNGDGFDIPYLTKKAMQFGISDTFSCVQSIDIFKAVKLFKTLLNTENLKQKSIEKFLGIKREDRYNGGELIEVYREYLLTHDSRLYNLLILHNAEDIAGMPDILPILAYARLTDISVCGINVPDISLADFTCDKENEEAVFHFESDITFPRPCRLSTRTRFLQISDRFVTLRIRLFCGELKHFYDNYKDYYYLVQEDMAVHKSVAEFVDKGFRQKAKAANCYTKASGLFLPQAGFTIEPVFCPEYKSKELYFPCNEIILQDTALLTRYALNIISEMVK